MRCPVDCSQMQFHPCRDEGIHDCTSCHGLWIDGDAQKACFETGQQTVLKGAMPVRDNSTAGRQLFCPRCPDTPCLEVLHVEKVEIDRCPNCNGIWLDSGEFEAILDLRTKLQRRSTSERIADVTLTAADPIVVEVIGHAGELSKEAAGAIAQVIGEIIAGLLSGF